MNKYLSLLVAFIILASCSKRGGTAEPATYSNTAVSVDGISSGLVYTRVSTNPALRFSFSAPIQASSVNTGFSFRDISDQAVPFQSSFENNNQTVVITPSSPLKPFTKYVIVANSNLLASGGSKLNFPV